MKKTTLHQYLCGAQVTEACEKLGVSESYVSRLKSKSRRPSLGLIRRAASVIDGFDYVGTLDEYAEIEREARDAA